MPSIALAVGDVGLALPVQEALEAAGHRVVWDAKLTPAATARFDAVVLAAAPGMAALAEAWRDVEPPPALLAIGERDRQPDALSAQLAFVATTAPPAAIAAALDRALGARWQGRLSPAFARGALGLPAASDPLRDAAATIAGARKVSLDHARDALRAHAERYVCATPMVAELRDHRALEVPEIELTHRLDGAHTVRTVVASGAMPPAAAMKAVWALVSVGAATLGDEPPDLATPARRAVAEARRHLRARRARVAKTSIYDLLEVERGGGAGDVEQACRALAIRYSPERLAALDLAELGAQVPLLWEQLIKARTVFGDAGRRGLYDQKLAAAPPPGAVWLLGPYDVARAEQHFARGQKALLDGEPFRAVSEFAAAARVHPDHPDYEASLAWANYRAGVERGKEKLECARRERAAAEAVVYGRRPWPRALVALAMLCAATEDPESARWHLSEALQVDPNQPAAKALLGRLGGGRG